MGLVQRKIEAAGFGTISLSNIPDLTAAVSVPRLAGIEYPFGRTLGKPGDVDGQTAVLRATFQALVDMDEPGSVVHLPFKWPEPKAKARSHPAQPPPITTYLQRHPWHFPRLLSREIPK